MLFIHWNINPKIFSTDIISLRYYSLLFALAFISAFIILNKIYIKENVHLKLLDKLAVYVFAGTFIGARLGDCFFYDWSYYKNHLLEIVLPFTYTNKEFHFTGYEGLASHGGAIGILVSVYIYCKVYKQSFLWVVDRLVIAVALAAVFIRIGNFFNSEIIGKPSVLPWAIVFEKVDSIPRHPAQLYESLGYLIVFFILLKLYSLHKFRNGFLFGWFLVLVFSFRFCIEFLKEGQESFEKNMFFNVGQLLSIPFIVAGLFLLLNKQKVNQLQET